MKALVDEGFGGFFRSFFNVKNVCLCLEDFQTREFVYIGPWPFYVFK